MEKKIWRAIPGKRTLEDLADPSDFFAKAEADAWSDCRAPFSAHLARLSAELAADVYELSLSQWRSAGWQDCTFVVENRVFRLEADGDSRMQLLEREWRRRKARAFLQRRNVVMDSVNALRQIFVTDLGKAVVMTRVCEDGKIVVAISFIGTTEKLSDWMSNFKIRESGGLHSGFSALAMQFAAQAPQITLPELGGELNRETVTLEEILEECKKTDSRFVLWISGHSQGGGVAQAFVQDLLERGVRPEAIRAYTFAAPTVAVCNPSLHPEAYPIYNIVNADDLVTRIGAQVRLGVDCTYYPDDAFRCRYYGLETPHDAFDRMFSITSQLADQKETFAFAIAMMKLFAKSDEEGVLHDFFNEVIPHLSLLYKMSLSRAEIAAFFLDWLNATHAQVIGGAADEAQVAYFAAQLTRCMEDFGGVTSAIALRQAVFEPHHIRIKHDKTTIPAYIAIVRRYLQDLNFACWRGDVPQLCEQTAAFALEAAQPPETENEAAPDESKDA